MAQLPTEAKDFSLLQSIHTGSVAHTAHCILGNRNSSPRDKAARA